MTSTSPHRNPQEPTLVGIQTCLEIVFPDIEKIKRKLVQTADQLTDDAPDSAFSIEHCHSKDNQDVGAQIMITKNDTEVPRKWVNGTLGVIQSLSEDKIKILIKH